MSILSCDKHDMRYDTDFVEHCPRCDSGEEETPYLHRLIDRLLMPPPCMTQDQLHQLHKEAAQMLHLLSKRP